jgi:hypothetical protein
MTIKTHIETMQQLLLGLDINWPTTDARFKKTWLSMVIKLAGELEDLCQAEIDYIKPVKHGDQVQNYLDGQKMKGKYGTDTSLPI